MAMIRWSNLILMPSRVHVAGLNYSSAVHIMIYFCWLMLTSRVLSHFARKGEWDNDNMRRVVYIKLDTRVNRYSCRWPACTKDLICKAGKHVFTRTVLCSHSWWPRISQRILHLARASWDEGRVHSVRPTGFNITCIYLSSLDFEREHFQFRRNPMQKI